MVPGAETTAVKGARADTGQLARRWGTAVVVICTGPSSQPSCGL
jgi:hypothetical protein